MREAEKLSKRFVFLSSCFTRSLDIIVSVVQFVYAA